MLTITPITNVKNTINNRINFTSGVRTNHGVKAINEAVDVKHEGNFIADFMGTIKESPLFLNTFLKRQEKIEKELSGTKNKIDAIA